MPKPKTKKPEEMVLVPKAALCGLAWWAAVDADALYSGKGNVIDARESIKFFKSRMVQTKGIEDDVDQIKRAIEAQERGKGEK